MEVTDRRTAVDFAEVVRALVEEVYPEAEKVVLVMDNLNTHKLASLLRGVPAGAGPSDRRAAGDPPHDEARQLAEYGGDRAVGAGEAVPGPTDRVEGGVAARGGGVGGRAKRSRRRDPVAVHHGGRPDQAPPALPDNSVVADH